MNSDNIHCSNKLCPARESCQRSELPNENIITIVLYDYVQDEQHNFIDCEGYLPKLESEKSNVILKPYKL